MKTLQNTTLLSLLSTGVYVSCHCCKAHSEKEEANMKCGKLTAKLRDAVPVCFMVDGKEVKRFKNIEVPEEIKRLPYIDFKFDVPENGAITFKIHFEPGVLPDVWPDIRQRRRRARSISSTEIPSIVQNEECTEEPSEYIELQFGYTGEQRKQLVNSISEYTGEKPVYQNAPTFAYLIGAFMVDKRGTLIGPKDPDLIRHLRHEGF